MTTDDGTDITDQNGILKEVETFYKRLYSKNEDVDENVNIHDYLRGHDVDKLNDSDRDKLEGKLTYEETAAALKR